jgi:hypothetical protein
VPRGGRGPSAVIQNSYEQPHRHAVVRRRRGAPLLHLAERRAFLAAAQAPREVCVAFVRARSFSANSDRILRRFYPTYRPLLVIVLVELQRIGHGRIYAGTNPVPSERRPVFKENLSRETQSPPSNLSGF